MQILAITLIGLFFASLILSCYVFPEAQAQETRRALVRRGCTVWCNGNGFVLSAARVWPGGLGAALEFCLDSPGLEDLAKTHLVFAVFVQVVEPGSALTGKISREAVLVDPQGGFRECRNQEVQASTPDPRLRVLLSALDGTLVGTARPVTGLLVFERQPEPSGGYALCIPNLFDHMLDMFQTCTLVFDQPTSEAA